jgi:hypothetical protein
MGQEKLRYWSEVVFQVEIYTVIAYADEKY